MTAIDTKLLAEVYTIAETYGKSVVFTVPGSSTYAPSTGKVTEGSVVTHTVNVTPPEQYDRRYVDGELVQARDVQVILPAKNLAFTPDLGMKVTFDSEAFDIVSLNPLYSGTSICAYEVQLRQ
tara:strand:- start:595 stop:963 length:369 start_codon:yes stop_codon:yes gene_type:complete